MLVTAEGHSCDGDSVSIKNNNLVSKTDNSCYQFSGKLINIMVNIQNSTESVIISDDENNALPEIPDTTTVL